jgi:hypothetical protein
VYDLFNKVLILSQGETIYFGDSSTAGVLRWFEHAFHRSLPRGTSIPDFVLDLVNVSFLEEEGQGGREEGVTGGNEGGKGGKPLLVLEEQQGSSSSFTSASTASSSSLSSNPSLTSSLSPSPSQVEKKDSKKKMDEERKEEEAKQQQRHHHYHQQKGPLDIVKAAALFCSSPSFLALREEIAGVNSRALSLEKKDGNHHQNQQQQQQQQQQLTTKERIWAATHKGEIGWGYRFQVGRGRVGGRDGWSDGSPPSLFIGSHSLFSSSSFQILHRWFSIGTSNSISPIRGTS